MKIGQARKISVATYYFDSRQGSTLANNAKGMLLTILHSMVLQNINLLELLQSSFPDARNIYQGGEWDLIQLEEVVKLASSYIPHPFYIFLDGFDEFSGNNEDQLDLIQYLLSLSLHKNVHICIASRPHPVLQKVLRSISLLDMQDWNLPGLTSYIIKAFDKIGFVQLNADSSDIDHLSKLMATMAEGVFLWANFAVQAAIELWTQEQLEFSSLLHRLVQLPHDVESLWERRFQILDHSERALGICLIRLVCSAARPLMVTELLYMARRQSKSNFDSLLSDKKVPEINQTVAHLSAGLLEIKQNYRPNDSDSQIVLIVHKSVRSYIERRGIWLSGESSYMPDQAWIEACIDVIEQATFARERSLCYQNKAHDTSNSVCKAHGCYATYPPDEVPKTLYEDIYESINQCMPSQVANASLQRKSATGGYNFAALANDFLDVGMRHIWQRKQSPTFIKHFDSDATYMLAYALHWLSYHSWILENRKGRSVSETPIANPLMCPELIMLMARSRYHSCAFCINTTAVIDPKSILEFHGSDHRLFAHVREDDQSGNTEGGEADVFFPVVENDLLHRRVYKMFAHGYNSLGKHALSPSIEEIRLARTLTRGSEDVCLMDLARPAESSAIPSPGGPPQNHFTKDPPKLRKFAIVGSIGCGKSSLTIKFVNGQYVDSYYPTIEHDFYKMIRYKDQDYWTGIVDTSGQDEYSILNSRHFIGIHGYIIVYSVESRSNFNMVRVIYEKILNHLAIEQIPCVIVGNKCKTSARQVSIYDGQSLAEELGCAFIEADPRLDVNVTTVFELMLAEVEKVHKSFFKKSNACTVQ